MRDAEQGSNLPIPRRTDNLLDAGTANRLWRFLAAGFAIACGAGAAMTGRFALAVCNDLPRYYHHDLWFFLWVCAFLVAWVGLHGLSERWLGRAAPSGGSRSWAGT